MFGGWTISPYCPNNNTHTWIPPTGNTKCVLHLMKSVFMLKKYVHVIWMYSICHVVIVMWWHNCLWPYNIRLHWNKNSDLNTIKTIFWLRVYMQTEIFDYLNPVKVIMHRVQTLTNRPNCNMKKWKQPKSRLFKIIISLKWIHWRSSSVLHSCSFSWVNSKAPANMLYCTLYIV